MWYYILKRDTKVSAYIITHTLVSVKGKRRETAVLVTSCLMKASSLTQPHETRTHLYCYRCEAQ